MTSKIKRKATQKNIGIPSLVRVANKSKLNSVIVGIDPGETTGICCMQGDVLVTVEQLKTKNLIEAIERIDNFLKTYTPDIVAYEDYRIYSWKSDTHINSGLHTPKLIGVIETLCLLQNVKCVTRMAQPAKKFVTDDKLRAWDLWVVGQQHARDAIRHAVFELCNAK